MKKIAMILCMAACGLMASAQAQTVVDNSAQRANRNVTQVTEAENMMPVFKAPRIKAADDVVYDTLHWGEEYLEGNDECAAYSYYLRWQDGGFFEHDVMIHAWGSDMNGTGEFGASFRTKDDAYLGYTGVSMDEMMVVGAVAYSYRQGSFSGWERVGVDFTDQYEEINGVKVPKLPYKVKGYAEVVDQDAIEYLNVEEGEEIDIVSVLMPVTMEGVSSSEVKYMPFPEARANSSGTLLPVMNFFGGMFDKPIPAGKNFGVSIEVQLMNDKTYDSLWNFAIGMKSGENCSFFETRLSWERIDYSHEKGWNMYRNKDGSPLICSDPEEGFMVEGCPQHDNGNSLFVPTCSQYFMTGKSYLPAIYGILQDAGTVANENQDAYAMTVSVYPLPASDIVNLVSIDPMKQVEIYNLAGVLVKHITSNDNVMEIDVTGLPSGSYVAKVITDKGVASKKLVVK